VFLLASVLFFTGGLRREAEAVFVDGPDMVVQGLQAGRHTPLPATLAEELADIRGVGEAKARTWGYHYDPETRANYTLMASEDMGLGPDEAALGNGIARLWGVREGDSLSLKSTAGELTAFRVARIFDPATELLSADLLVLTPETLRRFFDLEPGLATDIALTIPNPNEAPNIARKVAERFPGTRPVLKEEILATYRALFDWRGGIVLLILAAAVLAFFILAWDKATGLSHEERAEIGTLKALGWDTADVLMIRIWEGIILSSSAFLLGLILAWTHVFPAGAALFEPVLRGWSTLYPAFRPLPSTDLLTLFQLLFFTVVPYSLAGIVPAWRVAITDPSEALR
jgi:ABC-type lipoprotein release transport system permease subunit